LVAVVGLPNTGKSSLINTLSGRAAAGVAPIPGKTRGEQKVKVSNSIRMFDTPGVIPVQLPEKHNILLGLTPITQIDDVEWAAGVLYEQSMELNPGLVASYYNVPENPKTFLDLLAESRKFLLKGGTPDTVAAARLFLADHVRAKFVIHEQVERPLRLSG
jgi:ribosome biogenesis GTPase A